MSEKMLATHSSDNSEYVCVQAISEHTTKVRSVFRNSEIKRLNGPQIKPTTDSMQNPKSLLYCLRHKHLRVTKFKFE